MVSTDSSIFGIQVNWVNLNLYDCVRVCQRFPDWSFSRFLDLQPAVYEEFDTLDVNLHSLRHTMAGLKGSNNRCIELKRPGMMLHVQPDQLNLKIDWADLSAENKQPVENLVSTQDFIATGLFTSILEALGGCTKHQIKPELWSYSRRLITKIDEGEEWTTKVPKLFSDVQGLDLGMRFASTDCKWIFELPDKVGRLYIDLRKVVVDSSYHAVELRFMARGNMRPEDSYQDKIKFAIAQVTATQEKVLKWGH